MAVGRLQHGEEPFGGDAIGSNPTDRGKAGTKKGVRTDADGGPLSLAVGGANIHDCHFLSGLLDWSIMEPPAEKLHDAPHVCLDKGFDNPTSAAALEGSGYQGHVRRIGEEKLDDQGEKRHPARRWVVERTFSWFNRCRSLLVRYDKKAKNFIALLNLASVLLWFRRLLRLYSVLR